MIAVRPLIPYYFHESQKLGIVQRALYNVDWLLSYSSFMKTDMQVLNNEGKKIFLLEENYMGTHWSAFKFFSYLGTFATFYFVPQYRKQIIEGIGALVLAKITYRLIYTHNQKLVHDTGHVYTILNQRVRDNNDQQHVDNYRVFQDRFKYEAPLEVQSQFQRTVFERRNFAAATNSDEHLERIQEHLQTAREIAQDNASQQRKLLEPKVAQIKQLFVQAINQAVEFNDLARIAPRLLSLHREMVAVFNLQQQEKIAQPNYENPFNVIDNDQSLAAVFQTRLQELMVDKVTNCALDDLPGQYDEVGTGIQGLDDSLRFDYQDALDLATNNALQASIGRKVASNDPATLEQEIAQAAAALRLLQPKLYPNVTNPARIIYPAREHLIARIKEKIIEIVNQSDFDTLAAKTRALLTLIPNTATDFEADVFALVTVDQDLKTLLQVELRAKLVEKLQGADQNTFEQVAREINVAFNAMRRQIDLGELQQEVIQAATALLEGHAMLDGWIKEHVAAAPNIDAFYNGLTHVNAILRPLRALTRLGLGSVFGIASLIKEATRLLKPEVGAIMRNATDMDDLARRFTLAAKHFPRFKAALEPTREAITNGALTPDNVPADLTQAILQTELPPLAVQKIHTATNMVGLVQTVAAVCKQIDTMTKELARFVEVNGLFGQREMKEEVNNQLTAFENELQLRAPSLQDLTQAAKDWIRKIKELERLLDTQTNGLEKLRAKVENQINGAIARAFDDVDQTANLYRVMTNIARAVNALKTLDGLDALDKKREIERATAARFEELIEAELRGVNTIDDLVTFYNLKKNDITPFGANDPADELTLKLKQAVSRKFGALIDGQFNPINAMNRFANEIHTIKQKIATLDIKNDLTRVVGQKFGAHFERIANFAGMPASARGFSVLSFAGNLMQACWNLTRANNDKYAITAHGLLTNLKPAVGNDHNSIKKLTDQNKPFCKLVVAHMLANPRQYGKNTWTLSTSIYTTYNNVQLQNDLANLL